MAAPKKYPDELMDRGVRLVFKSGRPITPVARDLVAGMRQTLSTRRGPDIRQVRAIGQLPAIR
jgi:hypothetical protein